MIFTNVFVIIYLSAFVLSLAVRLTLDLINHHHRKKMLGMIPEEFAGHVDEDNIRKTDSYLNDKFAYSMVSMFIRRVIALALLLCCVYPWYYQLLLLVSNNFFILSLLFFAGTEILDTIISIPFSLYFNFVIEKKHGFNKMSLGLWVVDFIKDLIISTIMGVLLIGAVLLLLQFFPNYWWVFAWGFMITFSLVMQVIYPQFIAPMFNKFEPLKDEELKAKIETLLQKTGYKSEGVFQMDASKRSGHSNAYFTGIGKAKRIVLFDTLIEQMTHEEIIAVLAHEIGHYKKKHILKGMLKSMIKSFVTFFLAAVLIKLPELYNGFGFDVADAAAVIPLRYIGIFLLGIVSGPISFFFSPLHAISSRRHEYEADAFSAEYTENPEALVEALIKLNVKNLSNLHPAKSYVWFYYSHPTVLDRIRALRNK